MSESNTTTEQPAFVDESPIDGLCDTCGSSAQFHAPVGPTARPWHFETVLYKNSADAEYRIMGTNEDAGKSGVSYSGRYLSIATTESRDDALLIVRAVNSHDALVSFVLYVRQFYQRYFDVMPVAFQTVDSEAERVLLNIEDSIAAR